MGEFGTFDMQMLGITEDQIKEVDASDAEVVSRVLMSRIKDIVATIRPDGITFNTTSIRCMTDVVHIQMFVDRSQHRLYVEPAEEFDKDSYRWCNEKNGKRTSRKLTGRDFGNRIYEVMGWCKAYTYRVSGYPAKQTGSDGEYLLVYELDDFDSKLLTEKGLAAAGVEDSDLGKNAKQIHADIAEEQAQKEKAREEAKLSGKNKRARKKKTFFGVVEDGAFGVTKKEHVDKLYVPPLEELDLISLSHESDGDPPEGGDGS